MPEALFAPLVAAFSFLALPLSRFFLDGMVVDDKNGAVVEE